MIIMENILKKQLVQLLVGFSLSFGVVEGMQNAEDLIKTDLESMLMMRYHPNKIIEHLRASQYANERHLFEVISSNYINSKAKLEALQLIMQKLEHNPSDVKRIKELTLVYSAQFGEIDLVKFLLEQDVRIDVQDDAGNTSLHYAMLGVDEDRVVPVRRWVIVPELVKFLVDNGADLSIQNQNGETPLDMLFYSLDNKKIDDCYNGIQKEGVNAKDMLDILSFLKEKGIDIRSVIDQHRQKLLQLRDDSWIFDTPYWDNILELQ